MIEVAPYRSYFSWEMGEFGGLVFLGKWGQKNISHLSKFPKNGIIVTS